MSQFRECEICGAALDPGEKCDCAGEKGLPAICCTQPPVIVENLDSVRQNLEILLADISTLPQNDEALKYVKQIRANLAKEFEKLEVQRKAAKRQIMEPYDQAEAKYKEYISGPYRAADDRLKKWVDDYQEDIKQKCVCFLREYFAELCQSFNIDFLRYEDCGVKVDMTLARQKEPRKAMDQIYQFVDHVHSDVETIMLYDSDEAAEVFNAYRNLRFNLGEALAYVDRKKREAQQSQARISAMKQTADIEAEAVKKVDAIAPPVATYPVPEKEPIISCTFKAIGTRTQIKKMKEFAIKEGIRFE